ncbi:quercetin 2,3-dioxygenase [Pseudonocardia bannensis]|uniref:Cupin domain-containing protein n=1 Tax=Pseudonocardia bannensis TaxID=630973 RepID=A0A848DQ46_9PSEU|nr:quercetin 2,3-dioxygenase [Pseudonocardia bannensis]NMH94665.1 cupin domain-containing protein [Pseudonocardia bannensis]
MAVDTAGTPFALLPDEGEARWFLNSFIRIKSTGATTGGRLAVVEQRGPRGPASPLHVHHREAEFFYVIEGELTVWAGGELLRAPQGSLVYGPPEVPHTFAITSDEARFLVMTQPAGFEQFLEEASVPARELTLPPDGTAPADPARLAAMAAEHGIEILGPPGLPT